MQDIPERVLLEASQGNIEAFEEIYKATAGFVYSIAMRIIRNSVDAEEITQDVFMKVYQNLQNFEFRSSFRTWVYRITVNSAISRYRASRKERYMQLDYDKAIEKVSDPKEAAACMEQHDSEKQLNSLLDMLNPEQRACLVLREIEGLSYQEIAETLQIPINTVRSRLKRAREALMEQGKGRFRNEL